VANCIGILMKGLEMTPLERVLGVHPTMELIAIDS